MRTNRLLSYCAAILLLETVLDLGRAAPASSVAKGDAPGGPVTLTTTRQNYLLGEPVVLGVAFKNHTGADLTVAEYDVPGAASIRYEPNIRIFVSRDQKKLEEFMFGFAIANIEPTVRTLGPGEVWDHELRLFFSRVDGGKLAFPEPGTYYLKTVYPLVVRGSRMVKMLDSNVIAIKVTEPNGLDAKVWQRMQDKDVYLLLQSSWGPKEPALKVAELLREFPKSNYRATLWHGLREFYFKQNYRVRPEGKQIREALGINETKFVADTRLDTAVRGIDDQEISVKDILFALSAQTGVSLDAATELKSKKVRLSSAYIRLRSSILTISHQLQAPWWPQDDGYLLSRDPPAADSKSPK